jgi:zinc/manganese transport system ATP-binding protein
MPKVQKAVEFEAATLQFGNRVLWKDLDVAIETGEFIAVLGPNGSGKTTFLKVLLGLQRLTHGSVLVRGLRVGTDNQHIGYVPQQKSFDRWLPVRGRDLVHLGLDGNKFGFVHQPDNAKRAIDAAIEAVGAMAYADTPIGLLSGGEQQRLRIAQAIVGEPDLLLCDEPLLSLDVTAQAAVASLINDYRKQLKATVIFVTHEINPILPYVDRVLYIANGQWVLDTPDRVLQSRTLSRLYGSTVEVVNVRGRLIVLGTEEAAAHHEVEA